MANPASKPAPQAVTGVHLMQGIGHQAARGFWAEAWSKVLRRPAAVLSLSWIALVALLAVIAPLLASGHPIVVTPPGESPLGTVIMSTIAGAFSPSVGLPALLATLAGTLLWAFFPRDLFSVVRVAGGAVLLLVYGAAAWVLFRPDAPGDTVVPWLLAVGGIVGLAWIPAALDMPTSLRYSTAWLPLGAGLGVLVAMAASDPAAVARGDSGAFFSPLVRFLTGMDIVLIAGLAIGVAVIVPTSSIPRSKRAWGVVLGLVAAACVVLVGRGASTYFSGRDVSDWMRDLEQQPWLPLAVCGGATLLIGTVFSFVMPAERGRVAVALALIAACLGGSIAIARWTEPLERYSYARDLRAGQIEALYTFVPWSPAQGSTTRDFLEPGRTVYAAAIDPIAEEFSRELGGVVFADDPRFGARPAPGAPALAELELTPERVSKVSRQVELASSDLTENTDAVVGDLSFAIESDEVTSVGGVIDWLQDRSAPGFAMGTDSLGQDVLSQMLHACRLSISIGLVSSSIAVVIGVTMGALMGYFGGWIDMVLYRVVEIFMAVPVLFLLIVAAGVLPRNTYVMMAIIGCFSWTGAARFTRAEFLKLRNQDFVQAARSAGLPLHRVLFRHILPNGVTPVLVDTSFLIAVAITIEVILSYLGLGPANQASWGRLLSDATTSVGQFVWWLAMIPGAAIFLTVLSYNLIGEALRDAIDPKLAKARH